MIKFFLFKIILINVYSHKPYSFDFDILPKSNLLLIKMNIGTPKKEAKLLIDIGSDISWVNANIFKKKKVQH